MCRDIIIALEDNINIDALRCGYSHGNLNLTVDSSSMIELIHNLYSYFYDNKIEALCHIKSLH
jgi:hypothetical protein